MAEIQLLAVDKRFADFVAVQPTDLTIKDGEFFVLLGPSGCGKTTTLRMIAGLEIPSSGNVLLEGEDVTHARASQRDIAFVFQLFALYPHMSVWQNLAFPLKAQRGSLSRAQIRERVLEVASLLRIEHLLKLGVGALAGGDRQRVALGRAIIRRPKAFLMDEPLGTLDAEFRELMCEELRQLHDRITATTVYVTHDQIEAMAMADRIAVMDRGKILQAATPDVVYDHPATKFVASFIGSPAMNFLPAAGRLDTDPNTLQIPGAKIELPRRLEGSSHEALTLGVRPEHIAIDDNGPLRGTIYGVEYMGARQLLTVDTEAGRLKIRAPNTTTVQHGERVGLRFQTERLVLFDEQSGRALAKAPRVKEAGING